MAPARILIVHDGLVAEIVKAALQADGHQIDIVSTACEALEKFAPNKYDLVFIGEKFSVTSGEEVAYALKQRAPSQRTSIIPAPFLFQDIREEVAALSRLPETS